MWLNKKLQGENNNEEDFGSDCPCGGTGDYGCFDGRDAQTFKYRS